MIKITHEFPLCYYLDGTAEKLTDYDYCLVHRYLAVDSYKYHMKNQITKGRTVYLDNSLYELGEAWDDLEYANVIEDLRPSCYMLPDVFYDTIKNEESHFEFLRKYPDLPGTPIAIPHASCIKDLRGQLKLFCEELPGNTMIAIPFADKSFLNDIDNGEGRFFSSKDIPYIPLRQALNRKLFIKENIDILKNRKIHLLGCKSLAEFDQWSSNFPKENIVSLDTSHPVAFTLEGNNNYEEGFFKHEEIKMANHFYKPTFLIDKFFNVNYNKDLGHNVRYFQSKVLEWSCNDYER